MRILCGFWDGQWLKDWFFEVITTFFDKVFQFVMEQLTNIGDLIGVDFSAVVDVLTKVNTVLPVDVILVDFGIVLGVWFICLVIRAIINLAPTIGG